MPNHAQIRCNHSAQSAAFLRDRVRHIEMNRSTGTSCIFSHFLVIRAQEALPPTPVCPQVTYTYSTPGAPEFPPSTPSFAYPDAPLLQKHDTDGYACEQFIFVLTLDDGQRMYGYTRRFLPIGSAPRYPEALSLVSTHFAPELFLEILEHAHVRWLLQPGSVFVLLDALAKAAYPQPGTFLQLEWSNVQADGIVRALKQQERLTFQRKDYSFQPRFPILPLARILGMENLVLLFSALTCEQRIILVSRKLDRLSDGIHAALALLSPLTWQHILIPLLPFSLLSYCLAPMPYIVGLREEYLDELLALPGMDQESILIVDLDAQGSSSGSGGNGRISRSGDRWTQVVITEEDEEESEDATEAHTRTNNAAAEQGSFNFPLPHELGFKLRKHLKSRWNSSDFTDLDLYESFQTFWISLLAAIDWNEISLSTKGKVDMDSLLRSTEQRMEWNMDFIRILSQSQSFEQFVTSRVIAAQKGTVIGGSSGILTPHERFEKLRKDILAASIQEIPAKPFLSLRSFSFVLKRLHAANEAVSGLVYNTMIQSLPPLHEDDPPRCTKPDEARKLTMDLTSNSAFPTAARKMTVAQASDILSGWTLSGKRIVDAVVDVLCERMGDAAKGNHLHGSKSLLLLEYLIKHSASDLLISASMFDPRLIKRIQQLAYTYQHEQAQVAENIHTIALRLTALLQNIFLLRKTRLYVKVFDLRRFRHVGGGGRATSSKAQGLSVDTSLPSSSGDDIHRGDPEYDAFRHRSLVEMLVPALPPFAEVHRKYREEFDSAPAQPTPGHIRRASFTSPTQQQQDPQTWSPSKSPASIQKSGSSAPSSTVTTGHNPAAEFDFAAFDGSSGFLSDPVTSSPQRVNPLRAIMPPSGFTAPPPGVGMIRAPSQVQPNSTVHATPPRTQSTQQAAPRAIPQTTIIDTSIFAVPAPPVTTNHQQSPPPPPSASPLKHAGLTLTPGKVHAAILPPKSGPVAPTEPAQTPPKSSSALIATASTAASPWAAFDDAFSVASPVRDAPVALGTVSPLKSIAPPAPTVVDPTAGLDLFFSAPAVLAQGTESEKREKKEKKAKKSKSKV